MNIGQENDKSIRRAGQLSEKYICYKVPFVKGNNDEKDNDNVKLSMRSWRNLLIYKLKNDVLPIEIMSLSRLKSLALI